MVVPPHLPPLHVVHPAPILELVLPLLLPNVPLVDWPTFILTTKTKRTTKILHHDDRVLPEGGSVRLAVVDRHRLAAAEVHVAYEVEHEATLVEVQDLAEVVEEVVVK